MMSVLPFFAALAVLLLEGRLIAGYFVRERGLRWTLALPVAALSNVYLFFLLTILHLPLTLAALGGGHLVMIAFARFFVCSFLRLKPEIRNRKPSRHQMLLLMFCMIIISSAFLYSLTHAVLLPTFHYDSVTNWIGRSKASFLEQRIVFDNAPPHDMIRKPHYPFLLHAWHVAANAGRPEWSDRAANAAAFLLSWSMLLSIGLLIARLRGWIMGVVGLAVLMSIPLFAVHLGEGYADHLLAEFGAVAMLCLGCAAAARDQKMILLSALFAAAAVWTKAEGLFVIFLPWMLLLPWTTRSNRRPGLRALLLGCFLSLPWPLFAFLTGLPLTPHGASDAVIGLQEGSFTAALHALFRTGSFGVLWYALPLAIVLLGYRGAKHDPHIDRALIPFLLFGIVAFAIVLATYTLTPNALYLENAQSFDRQMLAPAALLSLACIALWKTAGERGKIDE